jgi:hypothetical protein
MARLQNFGKAGGYKAMLSKKSHQTMYLASPSTALSASKKLGNTYGTSSKWSTISFQHITKLTSSMIDVISTERKPFLENSVPRESWHSRHGTDSSKENPTTETAWVAVRVVSPTVSCTG